MGKLTLFCLLVLVVALAVPAYAEVQNVKVSGDITARALFRNHFDLTGSGAANGESGSDDFFMSDVGLNVGADLTDNVSTTVRLVSQRDWDRGVANANDVSLDLGYVTLKEILYAPLTLTAGRQDLWYGKGLIVGSGLLAGGVDPNSSISADEFSDLTAFDAVRATLDYNPWAIDLVYSKVDGGVNVNLNDDTDLYGANIGYKFNSYNAEAEAYYFRKQNKTSTAPTTVSATNEGYNREVNVVGGRGSVTPLENLNIFGELAYEFGKHQWTTGVLTQNGAGRNINDIAAWAANAGADYTFKTVMWEPKLALEYVFYSGEEQGSTSGEYNAWDPIYRGKFDTLIHEFLTSLYATDDANDDLDGPTTNRHQFLVSGTVKPLDSLTAKLLWAYIQADENIVSGRSKDIGDEVDLQLTYDYTQDVQFGLLAGLFIPGSYYQSPNDATASEVVASMKVTF